VIAHNRPTLGREEEAAAIRVIRSGWVAQGAEVAAFEEEFCDFLGLPAGHAVAVSSGTAALYLALWALEAAGKRVAIPVYACSALRNAVALAKAEQILIDVVPGSPNVDPAAIAGKAEIAIVAHMHGLPQLLPNHGMAMIEDCAQALGAKVCQTSAGLQGDLGIFSFYATKLITSAGQGGMIVSTRRNMIERIRDYRQFDCRRDSRIRFNFQMTDLQAAVGREQLRKLPGFLSRREEIFERYRQAGLTLLDVPDRDKKEIFPVRYRAVLTTLDPVGLLARLDQGGVKAIVPIEDWELLGPGESFPNAQHLTRTTVSLPLYPSLSDDEADQVIDLVKKFI
jgi:perosamine synthetase